MVADRLLVIFLTLTVEKVASLQVGVVPQSQLHKPSNAHTVPRMVYTAD